ncbi:MAG: AsnC family transcriptional regulator [ANME-2 cluster archaeon]|nr:AsnC family transcriptional regulator [ANME-2 cluster archaeon]
MAELDELDIKILTLLQEEGRQSFREVAKKTHTSVPTIGSRVERMQQLGIIRRFTIDIDQEKIEGYQSAVLIIDVKPSESQAIVSRLSEMDEVVEISVSSDSDFGIIAKVVGSADDVMRIQNSLTEPGINKARAILIRDVIKKDATNMAASLIKMSCSYCSKEMAEGAVKSKIDDKNYYFCCNTCKSAFMDKYQGFKKKS